MRAFSERLHSMTEEAYYILCIGVVLSLVCAVCALIVLVYAGDFSPHRRVYELWQYAKALFDAPKGILLASVLGSAIVEDAIGN